ncbi:MULTISPECIES: hypothetical protein [unclassified Ensifer]|uniref:hypothetical protein n=1 Tax=unclassified Ensifer TaxID=2633371 RepID=UPI00081306ED|nr:MULTISPECIES: hypothetical protein [unclassified Ensifer]OCP00551.1 hypothetical protein BC362_24495 [Ensifer sp. LC14]OCP05916.1 hypothetical protein BBX50_05460 [Ensifer sp. LC11]OCP06670.1 hypothetical protein BC374_05520 [Ensifer sp. LC13]OCP31090.1 hypothetical protein BC364_04575 [Ensifer sp. LC499]
MRAETTRRALAWAHGCLSVQSLGGMLGPVLFLLPDGRQVSPLHVAPWGNDAKRETLPETLQELRGEWPCVPFGSDADRSLPAGWSATGESFEGASVPHGQGSNAHWTWGDCDDRRITMQCHYPEEHPIRLLRRRIVPDPHAAAVDITLEIEARRPCRLPIGLHPTFRLPPRPGAVTIEPGRYGQVWSFPGDVEPGAALFTPDRQWPSLGEVDTRNGTTVDATQVPLAQETEDLLQLSGIDGSVALHYRDEGFRARLSWQKEHFPSLLLWFSNRGRKAYPWNGRHVALGVEPIASAFDLGPAVSAANNPVAASGVATAIAFKPDQTFTTRYRLSVEAAPIG